jgi:Flp pilus assembly protein protease CpaA
MSLFSLGSIAAFAGVSALPWIVVIAVAAAAARVDLRTGRIPNKLTGPVLLAGLLWGLAATAGLLPTVSGAVSRGIGDSMLGALLAGFPFVILWLGRGAGAGDAKLMMGIGAWLGLAGGTLALACTAIAGGLIAIVWAVSRGQLMATVARLPRAAVDLIYIFRGPGRMADRRDLVLVGNSMSAAAAETESEPGIVVPADGTGPSTRFKLRYSLAILPGVCAAALRVWFS